MKYAQPKSYDSVDAYSSVDYVTKHGFLGCGFDGGYSVAEAFMAKVAAYSCPQLEIDLAVKGIDIDNISIETLYTAYSLDYWSVNSLLERIFVKCVFIGWFFNGFLNACAETKFLDNWLLSEIFMSNVHAGSIRGMWSIFYHHENETKEPYRSRFREFIKSLDDRGLGWTQKYLEPDTFFGKREVYWL